MGGSTLMETEFSWKLKGHLERCRRLADNTLDSLTRERLLQLAEELDQQLRAEQSFS